MSRCKRPGDSCNKILLSIISTCPGRSTLSIPCPPLPPICLHDKSVSVGVQDWIMPYIPRYSPAVKLVVESWIMTTTVTRRSSSIHFPQCCEGLTNYHRFEPPNLLLLRPDFSKLGNRLTAGREGLHPKFALFYMPGVRVPGVQPRKQNPTSDPHRTNQVHRRQ